MKKYDEKELEIIIDKKLDLWKNINFKYIECNLKFKDFKELMIFINKVADLAEEVNHHPDIFISYNKLNLQLATHSEKAITILDTDLAYKIQELYKNN